VQNLLPETTKNTEEQTGAKKPSYSSVLKRNTANNGNGLVTINMCTELVTKALENKEKRKLNVVIHNIPESEEEETEKRVEHDSLHLKSVCAQLDVTNEVKISQFYRIGRKREEGNRPLLVKLGCQEEKELLLRRGHRCRNFIIAPATKQVAVAPDLSREEREEAKNLWTLLKEKRKTDPDLVIRGGKIVKKKSGYKEEAENTEQTDPPSETPNQ